MGPVVLHPPERPSHRSLTRIPPKALTGDARPENTPLGVQPTMQELTDAIRSLANGKVVGPDGVSVGLFKITLNGDPALRRRVLDMAVCIGTEVEGAAAVGICHHHGTPYEG